MQVLLTLLIAAAMIGAIGWFLKDWSNFFRECDKVLNGQPSKMFNYKVEGK